MTYHQFKYELELVRNNRKQIRSIQRELKTLGDDILSTITSGAVDYSKVRIQTTSDPDAKTINAIDDIDRHTSTRIQKIQELLDKNERIESYIWAEDGLEAEVVRLYTIEGWPMFKVGENIGYSKNHCWKMWNKVIYRIYERYYKDE